MSTVVLETAKSDGRDEGPSLFDPALTVRELGALAAALGLTLAEFALLAG